MIEAYENHPGRCEFVTLLGEGGMGRVYLAIKHTPLGFDKLVVIKHVRSELESDGNFRAMFFDEARIAARLNHPNVVQTYEVVEQTGRYLLVMEYLEGQTLSALLRRAGGSMPLQEHLWILTQVLTGLDYAHELRDYDGKPLEVVHCDASPANVFITYNGEVKLLDFGIAKAAGAISATRPGTVKGKLGYGAPEQFLGHPVDRRADVFSAGVMLWEALARKRRKLADTSDGALQAMSKGMQSNIRQVDPAVPVPLADICDKALAIDPAARYRTAGEFLRDLERYLQEGTRRVERREMADLMMRHFEKDRRKTSKRIEEQLAALGTPLAVEPTERLDSSRTAAVIDLVNQEVATGRVSSPDFRPWWAKKNLLRWSARAVGVLALVLLSITRKGPSTGRVDGATEAPASMDLPAIKGGALRTVLFESEPPDAAVEVDGLLVGRTPLRVAVEPGLRLVQFSRDGYDGVRVSLEVDSSTVDADPLHEIVRLEKSKTTIARADARSSPSNTARSLRAARTSKSQPASGGSSISGAGRSNDTPPATAPTENRAQLLDDQPRVQLLQ